MKRSPTIATDSGSGNSRSTSCRERPLWRSVNWVRRRLQNSERHGVRSLQVSIAGRYSFGTDGFTLFEVVLSLGIFLAAIAVIAQIIDTGARAAIRTELQSEAMWRCESQMNELVSGAQPLQDADGVACVDDPAWKWSLTTSEGPHPDLVALDVYVSHTRADGRLDADYLLRRYVRSPLVYEEAAIAAEAAAAEAEAAEAEL